VQNILTKPATLLKTLGAFSSLWIGGTRNAANQNGKRQVMITALQNELAYAPIHTISQQAATLKALSKQK
jgi:hypothetical protein